MPTGSSVAVLTSSCNNLYTTLVKTTTCDTIVQLLLFLFPSVLCRGDSFIFFQNVSLIFHMRWKYAQIQLLRSFYLLRYRGGIFLPMHGI